MKTTEILTIVGAFAGLAGLYYALKRSAPSQVVQTNPNAGISIPQIQAPPALDLGNDPPPAVNTSTLSGGAAGTTVAGAGGAIFGAAGASTPDLGTISVPGTIAVGSASGEGVGSTAAAMPASNLVTGTVDSGSTYSGNGVNDGPGGSVTANGVVTNGVNDGPGSSASPNGLTATPIVSKLGAALLA